MGVPLVEGAIPPTGQVQQDQGSPNAAAGIIKHGKIRQRPLTTQPIPLALTDGFGDGH
jgi:hypothetical protein